MSSPMINNVILCGCIVMYTVVFVNAAHNFDTPANHNCTTAMVRDAFH